MARNRNIVYNLVVCALCQNIANNTGSRDFTYHGVCNIFSAIYFTNLRTIFVSVGAIYIINAYDIV
jgi:hypothetical protein